MNVCIAPEKLLTAAAVVPVLLLARGAAAQEALSQGALFESSQPPLPKAACLRTCPGSKPPATALPEPVTPQVRWRSVDIDRPLGYRGNSFAYRRSLENGSEPRATPGGATRDLLYRPGGTTRLSPGRLFDGERAR